MQRVYRILVINPGSTSTKVALYENETSIFEHNIGHNPEEIARCKHIADQYPLRRDAVLGALSEAGFGPNDLDAVVGRGGMLRSVPSGTYLVNRRLLDDCWKMQERQHVANLGAVLAREIAPDGVPAYMVDPVSVDEFDAIARVAGLPGFERRSLSHALNTKAMARVAAAQLGQPYEAVNLVVAHMGGGISVSAHRRGRMVDVNQALDGTGPFSPERAGGLPVGDVMRMACSGKYTYDELFVLISRRGGLLAHLGTNDAKEVERRIEAGDEHAELIYRAMAYQIAKEIGLMATVLLGDVQAIVLTGGLAYSTLLVPWIRERVEWIAPLIVLPGHEEMLAMTQGALRVLRGQEAAKEY